MTHPREIVEGKREKSEWVRPRHFCRRVSRKQEREVRLVSPRRFLNNTRNYHSTDLPPVAATGSQVLFQSARMDSMKKIEAVDDLADYLAQRLEEGR